MNLLGCLKRLAGQQTRSASLATASRRTANRRRPQTPTVQLLVEELETRVVPAGSWTTLANTAPDGIDTMLLMTDGSVMAHVPGTSGTNRWDKLTPGPDGNYTDGTWSHLANMSGTRLYFASNVLPDGTVFVEGGEYTGGQNPTDTNTGEIYYPSTNEWGSTLGTFPQSNFGDDPSILLNNGQILCGYISGNQTYRYDPTGATGPWIQTAGSKLVRPLSSGGTTTDQSDEETWLKLPDGSVLSYDIFASIATNTFHAERYVPSGDNWVDASNLSTANPPSLLSSNSIGDELGGATLLPDGRAWFVGGNGHTAFYTPGAGGNYANGTWSAGPNLPNGDSGQPQMADDAPLCALPNGDVLVAADGPGPDLHSTNTHIYEFNPTSSVNPFTEVDPFPILTGGNNVTVFTCRMLALPTGQVLFAENGKSQLYVYTPSGAPQSAWQPKITGINLVPGFSLTPELQLSGTQLNGISAGASYGDDAEMDSNYAIVSYTDKNGHVAYADGLERNSTGVQTGSALVSTTYSLPTGFTDGAFLVRAIANGIASKAVLNVVMDQTIDNVTLEIDPSNSSEYDVLQGNTLLSQWNRFSFSAVDVTLESSGAVTIEGSLATAPINVYGAGQTAVDIINGQLSQGQAIEGAIDVEAPAGKNSIVIDDTQGQITSGEVGNLTSVNLTTVLHGSAGASGQLPSLATSLLFAPVTWKYADTSSVTILGPQGAVNWNILGTGAITTHIVALGPGTFNVGNAGSVQGILGTLNIESPLVPDAVNVNDSADAVQRSVTLSTLASNPGDLSFFGPSTDPWGQIAGLAPGIINFEYPDTTSFTLQTGKASGDTVTVLGTGVTTNIVGHALATVNVGNGGSLAGLGGTLNIENTSNLTNINIDDSTDTAGRTATFSDMGANPSDFEHNGNHWGQLTGLSAAPINYEYAGSNSVILALDEFANTVNILAAENTGLTGFSADAVTTVNVGSSSVAPILVGPLVLFDSAKSMTLTVNDSADTTARTVSVTPTAITGLSSSPIELTAGQVISVTFDGGSGGNTISVPSTAAGEDVFVNAGAGSDTITVGNAVDGLGDIPAFGLVSVAGSAGGTTLILNDSKSSAGGMLVFNSQVSQGFKVFGYSGIRNLILDVGGISNYEVDVIATPATTAVTINAASNDGIVHAGGTLTGDLGILGPLTVNGGGTTQVIVFDQSNANGETYTLGGNTLTRTGGFSLTYSNLQGLTVNGGSGNNTFSVSDFSAGLPTTISTGNGNDAVNITADSASGYNLTLQGGSGSNSLVINDPSRTSTFNPNPLPQNTGSGTEDFPAPGLNSTYTYSNMGSVSEKPDANHSFVQALFHGAYDRSGIQAELDSWVSQLPVLGQAGVAAAINHTAEAYQHVVVGWFQQFLSEQPSAEEEARYVTKLQNGATQEQVLADILATPEFLVQASRGRHEKSSKAYIEALYKDLLGMSENQIPPMDLQHWVDDLHRLGREGVALEFLQSDAYRTLQIQSDYERLLHRAATEQEVSDWLHSGEDLLSIQIGIESLPEFYTGGG